MPEPIAKYEKRDINVRVMFLLAVGLALGVALAFLTISTLYHHFGVAHPLPTEANGQLAPQIVTPEPRLQTDPSEDLRQLRAVEDNILNNYGWVDRKQGIVRLPIERAMDLMLQRGLPTPSGNPFPYPYPYPKQPPPP